MKHKIVEWLLFLLEKVTGQAVVLVDRDQVADRRAGWPKEKRPE